MEGPWEAGEMPAEEGSRGGLGGELTAHKAKRQERKRQELLALALGVRLGSRGTLLWKPLKLFASCPQISSPLLRRSALKECPERQCSYEKIHNFKVSCCLCCGLGGEVGRLAGWEKRVLKPSKVASCFSVDTLLLDF